MEGPWRRRGHWLVAVGPDRPTAERVEAGLATPDDPPHLWRDRAGGTLVATWGDARPAPPPTAEAPNVAVRGQLRWAGRGWEPGEAWPDVVVSRRVASPHGHPLDGAVGDGSAVVVGVDGHGAAGADVLGLANLFAARVGATTVLSSSPELAARARSAVGGGAVTRSAAASACLARVGYVTGGQTGYAGVRRVEAGRWFVLAPGRARLVAGPLAWCRNDALAGLTPDELVEVAAQALGEGIGAAVDAAAEPPVLDLTGGKDSRLTLAVAHLQGLLPRVRVRTVGDPSFPDVAVAARLAAALGIEHGCGIELRSDRPPLVEQVASFVEATHGMHTAWTSTWIGPGPCDVRLSGTSGEALRADLWERRVVAVAERADPPTVESFARWLLDGSDKAGGGLLRPEAAAEVDAGLREDLEDLRAGVTDPEDLGHAWYLQRHGVIMGGLRMDLERDDRTWVLADPTAVRAAVALGAAARRSDVVHATLVRRASPALAIEPLSTGEVWEEAARGLPRPEVATAPTSGPPAPRFSYLGVAKARPDDERRRFVTEAFADPDSGIWEVADRARVRDALDRFDELAMKPRQQLYGLATGAVWLTGA